MSRARMPAGAPAPVAARSGRRAADAALLARVLATNGGGRALAGSAAGRRELQRALGNRALGHAAVRGMATAPRLQRNGPTVPPKTPEQKWKEAGPFGGAVYKLLAEMLTPAEISSLLEKLPTTLGDAAGGLVKDHAEGGTVAAIGLEPDEVKKAVEAGAAWGVKAAGEWLKSPTGLRFLESVKTHLGDNATSYYDLLQQLVTRGMTTALWLYANNKLDPPNLEKTFKIGDGSSSVTAGIDLGKPNEQWFQAARLGFALQLSPRWNTSLMSTLAQDKTAGWTFGSTYQLRLGDEKKPDFRFDLAGSGSTGTGAYSGSVGVMSQPIGASYQFGWKPPEAGKPDLGPMHTLTLGGTPGAYNYSLAATWGLTEKQLEKLSASFGFKNKEETLSWLASIAAERKDDAYTVTGNLALQATVQRMLLKLEGKLGVTQAGDIASGGIAAGVGFPVGPFTLAPMAGLSYGTFDRTGTKTPTWLTTFALGAQIKDMPAMWSVGWNQPVGSGLPGYLSVGVTGRFDATKLLELFSK